ncbi:MAG: beta-N-acetylhexosaminidase [Hyphomicrobium sp.]
MSSADRRALIAGVSGTELTSDDRAFFRMHRPAGLILFARNCAEHDQIRALIDDVRSAVADDAFLVLIDQEGGRVQRLRPPLGRTLPAADRYAAMALRDPEQARRAAFDVARLTAADLLALGINTNCAPVLDVPVAGSHDIIGNRAYGTTPDAVVMLARAVAEGYLAGGVLPVIKHIPGHGRANADSHFDLPVVATPHADLSATDFAPFRMLSHLPAAMTAHVVFSAIDANAPASTSKIVTRDIIRGEIGFDGLLMSDDLSMKALDGTLRARAEAVIAAGSDVALHCNGNLSEMTAAADGCPALAGRALERFAAACRLTCQCQPFDADAAAQRLAEVLAGPAAIESV